MPEENIKKKLNRAIMMAVHILDNPPGIAEITFLKNSPFHIEVSREKEIRKIRITLDEITEEDERLVRDFRLPTSNCTKEIWCRKEKNGFICHVV